MHPSTILESALYVTDLDAAEAFYADVLGLERIAKAEGRHVFFRCGKGGIVEIQGTAEGEPFSEEQFAALMALARKGISRLVDLQKMAVG